MKDVLGWVGSLILDMKWVLLGCVFGGMLMARCAQAIEIVDQEAYGPIMAAKGTHGVIFIQKGHFQCPKDQNRAVFIGKDSSFKVGCAAIGKKRVHIEWEIGPASDMPAPGYTDGPAEENPVQPGVAPERDM
jgi:hypothetical protein